MATLHGPAAVGTVGGRARLLSLALLLLGVIAMASAAAHTPHSQAQGGEAEFICRKCGASLGSRKDVIKHPNRVLAREARQEAGLGPGHEVLTFRNPNGQRHDVAALSSVGTVTVMGRPTVDSTYYPPYAWRMATCSQCSEHIGWRFEQIPGVNKGAAFDATPAAEADGEAVTNAAADGAGGASPDDGDGEGDGDDEEEEEEEEDEEGAEDGAGAMAGEAEPEGPREPLPQDVLTESLLASLDTVCMTYPRGWWTFEWCHSKTMRQFHREPSGAIAQDWSLGSFNPAATRLANKAHLAATREDDGQWNARVAASEANRGGAAVTELRPTKAPYWSHVFTDGQPCDETGTGRMTEVRFACCDSQRGTHIDSIEEPATCKYLLQICVPQLCQQPEATAAGRGKAGDGASEAAAAAERRRRKRQRRQHKKIARQAAAHEAARRRRVAANQKAAKEAVERAHQYDPRLRRQFYGLLWNKVVASDDPDLWWIDAVKPVTALTR